MESFLLLGAGAGGGTRHNSRIAACFLGTVGYWALTTYTGLSVTGGTTGTPFQTTQAGDSMAPAAEIFQSGRV